jgi:hypothetical protein
MDYQHKVTLPANIITQDCIIATEGGVFSDVKSAISELIKYRKTPKELVEAMLRFNKSPDEPATYLDLIEALVDADTEVFLLRYEETQQVQPFAGDLDKLHNDSSALTHCVDKTKLGNLTMLLLQGYTLENKGARLNSLSTKDANFT